MTVKELEQVRNIIKKYFRENYYVKKTKKNLLGKKKTNKNKRK